MPDLTRWASEAGISHFIVGFTDLLGAQRSKLIHASRIGDALRNGVRFAGYAVWFDLSPEDPDLVAILEPESVVQLPWRLDVAWMLAAPQLRGEPLAQDPRHHLRRIAGRAAADGLSLRTGVECEFFLLAEGDLAAKPPQERHTRNSYRQDLLLRRQDVLAALSNAMAAMGWGPEQVSQEDAEGQFEITWGYDDAVTTADRHAFFRMMLRDIAGRHGLVATFMPKPFADRTGSGCHVHMSLWRNGKNLFLSQDPAVGLSPTGMRFVGGLVHSAAAMAAFTNPVVNSYKRLDASRSTAVPAWLSGAVSHAAERRTQLIRLLGGARCEFRLPDSAANPYLLQAAILAAGLDGIAQARDPGPPRRRARRRNVRSARCFAGAQATALQSARRVADAQAQRRDGGCLHRVASGLSQAEDRGVACLLPPSLAMGDQHDVRLLIVRSGSAPERPWCTDSHSRV